MRARAGDPPRTMAQKILAGRCADPSLAGDLVLVKVDQVVLARAPSRALAEAVAVGLKKTSVETAIAYEGAVRDAAGHSRRRSTPIPEMLQATSCSSPGRGS